MKSYVKIYGLALALGLSLPSLARGKTVRVVTYIEDVQEERRSTRWTLTEWLRIKERMKMMDVWLAMFSDPGKDKFAPELSLSYAKAAGESQFDLGSSENFNDDRQGIAADHFMESGRLQFWFTNLVSSTTGLRTLDIDIGLEGQVSQRRFDKPPLGSPFSLSTDKLQAAGVNLRLFGANSQDSTLVAKAGRFEKNTGYDIEGLQKLKGQYFGAEMALYFLKWLGAEGHYMQMKAEGDELWKSQGTQFDYSGFIEIYNLRLGYGSYGRDWTSSSESSRFESSEKGQAFFVRLYF